MAANEVCISEYADMVSTVRGAAQVAMDPPITADASTSQRIPAGTVIYRGVTLGAGNKIAVITAT